MTKVEELSQKLYVLIMEKRFKEAMSVYLELGEVLNTYQRCC